MYGGPEALAAQPFEVEVGSLLSPFEVGGWLSRQWVVGLVGLVGIVGLAFEVGSCFEQVVVSKWVVPFEQVVGLAQLLAAQPFEVGSWQFEHSLSKQPFEVGSW